MNDFFERIGFKEFDLSETESGECLVRVRLGWHNGSEFTGEGTGGSDETGQMRCAATG